MTEAIVAEKVAQLSEGAAIHQFCLAGKASFTIRSRRTDMRFTYRLNRSEDRFQPDKYVYFVNVLIGPDNENSYKLMGILKQHCNDRFDFVPVRGFSKDTPSVKAFRFFWDHLDTKQILHEGLEFFHAGRCGRCGRTLTVPESVESGYGPECRGYMG